MTKKRPALKSPGSVEKEQYNAFLGRFKSACDLMAGNDFFEHIPQDHLPQIFRQRMPPLKLEFAPGALKKEFELEWQNRFRERLTNLTVPMLTGKTMSIAEYFRDGYLLVNYADTMAKRRKDSPLLEQIAATYGPLSQLTMDAADSIMNFANSLCVIYSNISGKLLLTDYTTTAVFGALNAENKIKFTTGNPKQERIKIDGITRDLVALCWTNPFGKLAQVKTVPAKLGFVTEATTPIPVYFQNHVVTRLIERLSLPRGLLLYMLEKAFYNQDENFSLQEDHLLPLRAHGKKLGYLVVDLVEGMLVIRTFLFLTNDGTPEGRKLANLTRLKKLDKQYLGIDTMAGFSSLAIADDPILRQLFIEAGCADLLDLKEFNPILEADITLKNTDTLLRYLQNSPFMRKPYR